MSARCEARTGSGQRCQCKIDRDNGTVYAEAPGLGSERMVLCDNHRRMLQRGGYIIDRHGRGWRAHFVDASRAHYYLVPARCRARMPGAFPPDEPQPAVPHGRCGLNHGHDGPHTLLVESGSPWFGKGDSD